MNTYVKAQDKKLFFGEKELRLKGFGIGTWLNMEHFMLGIPTPDSMIQDSIKTVFDKNTADEFMCSFIDSFVTDEDFKLLKNCGINFLRVPFNYRLLIDDNNSEVYKEEGFRTLKLLIERCEKYEIFLMPDLHTAPGGQNPDWHSDNRSGEPQFWQFEVFRNQIISLWGEIAKRFSGYSYLLGYDLLNEPAMADEKAINSFYTKAINEIRKYDKNHAVIIEGDMFAMDFSKIEVPKDDNVILSFHYYPTVWHKDLLSKSLDRSIRILQMEDALKKLVSIREAFSLPTICGEAGYDLDKSDMEFSLGLLKDTLDLFNKYQVNYSIWSYKDADFMAMVHPKRNTPWINFADKVKKKWNHYGEMAQADRIIRAMGDEFGGLSEDSYYRLQFRLRGILYEMQKETILLPLLRAMSVDELLELPKSFALDNCEYFKDYFNLMKEYSQLNN